MEAPWTSRRGYQWSWHSICLPIHAWAQQTPRDQDRSLYSISPQTDGQTEHINKEIEQYLRLFVNQRQDDWYKWVSLAEFTYNNQIHPSTQTTPFMLNNGQHPRLRVELIQETRLETLREFTDRMEMATNEAHSTLQRAADDMTCFYDIHC